MRITKKIFVKCTLLAAINILIISIFTTIFSVPSSMKFLIEEFQESEKIDTIILGQSHAQQGFDPYILSQETGGQAFNLARPGVPVVNMPYLVQLAHSSHNIKTVILDVDFSYWSSGLENIRGTDQNLIFLLNGKLRTEYFKNICTDVALTNMLVNYDVSLRSLKNCKEYLYIKSEMKKSNLQTSYQDLMTRIEFLKNGIGEKGRYLGRGFFYNQFEMRDVSWNGVMFNQHSINKINLDAFQALVEFCKQNDIRLVCVQSVLPPQVKRDKNIEDMHTYCLNLCNQYGISFYDMNYVKSEYMYPGEKDFVDNEGHLTGEYAGIQSKVLGEILSSEDPISYFYDDINMVRENLNLN